MEIKVLGTRGEIETSAPYHSKHSGVLVDKKILLDVGEKEFLKYKAKYIFITHLHPDHAFFVRGKVREARKIKIPIFAPERYNGNKKIQALTKKIRLNSYKITPIPTHHSKLVKSQAYLIERSNAAGQGGQKILYTGDLIWIDKKYHNLLKGLDLVITDGSFIRKGGVIRRDKKSQKIYGHIGIPNLVDLFKKFTRHILFIHFGSWLYKDIEKARNKLQELAKEKGVKIYLGYDGYVYQIRTPAQ